ncbi:MAG: Druantia anti-phage system protein DruA [Methylococcales bacterium]
MGWDEVNRKQHLPRLLNNSRFPILPGVRIPNLASPVLALALQTVADDWEHHFGLRPWLAETFVDSSRFTGQCYRAANWIDVGMTTGRGRQDRDHQRHATTPKRVLLYPLRHDARQRLLSDSK